MFPRANDTEPAGTVASNAQRRLIPSGQRFVDHEFLNWIVPLGIVGDRPAEIVDSLDEQSQISFKVSAIWD